MGGRKKSSRKPVVRKPPPPLDKVFPCPFCANERVVTCKLYGRAREGRVGRNPAPLPEADVIARRVVLDAPLANQQRQEDAQGHGALQGV